MISLTIFLSNHVHIDCLLPSGRNIPPPFTPQECQELMGLLRSDSNGPAGNNIVRTRIVARVLIRQGMRLHVPLNMYISLVLV